MKTTEQRLNNVIGQLTGAKGMLAGSERDCFAVLTQLKAAKSALSAVMDKIVSEELDHCWPAARGAGKAKIIKIFQEIIKK